MTNPRHVAPTITLALCVVASLATAADDPEFTPIFDGKSFAGWKIHGCEAVIQDGAILLKAGNGVVHTEKQYGDFILDLEWKALRKEGRWDSGIYFRCDLPKGKRPWPRQYQTNLLRGQEGNLVGVKGAVSKGLVKDGEWNHFRLSVIGANASLEINGKPAWKAKDVIKQAKGYICLQSEVAGGGQFLFRNIRIAEPKP